MRAVSPVIQDSRATNLSYLERGRIYRFRKYVPFYPPSTDFEALWKK